MVEACKLLIATLRDLESLDFLEQCETALRHAIQSDIRHPSKERTSITILTANRQRIFLMILHAATG